MFTRGIFAEFIFIFRIIVIITLTNEPRHVSKKEYGRSHHSTSSFNVSPEILLTLQAKFVKGELPEYNLNIFIEKMTYQVGFVLKWTIYILSIQQDKHT